ncbi:hypothetical protein AVEN_260837-1 [Araneus ventricosus]|uniref:Uncharacterized protein n=1 Tax=Araneus ventricosus TaxID=182803 RepID=A0A4Y2USD4_ARAVE|nr:hypothetical protein AVEN_260837-1 [Araneus ventricosus]
MSDSFFWEGVGIEVKSNRNSGKGCQITQTVKIRDRTLSTPVSKSELSWQMGKADSINSIDPLRSKVDKCVLWIVDQHTRWGDTTPMATLKDQVTYEASLSNMSKTGKTNVIVSDNRVNFKNNLTERVQRAAKQTKFVSAAKQGNTTSYHKLESSNKVWEPGNFQGTSTTGHLFDMTKINAGSEGSRKAHQQQDQDVGITGSFNVGTTGTMELN